MAQQPLISKVGKPIFGIAIRNPKTYKEGEYRVYLYNTQKRRDMEAEKVKRYMPLVEQFEIDIAQVVGLT